MKPISPFHKPSTVAVEKLKEFVQKSIRMKDDVPVRKLGQHNGGEKVVLMDEMSEKNEVEQKRTNEVNEQQVKTIKYVPTICFGRIDFEETTTKDLPRFIRCAEDTKRDTLIELFTDYWNVEPPGVLISFTGGKTSFELDPHIKDDFMEGFSSISTKLNAWVIGDGIGSGVTELVGEAFYGTNNVCVGILPWSKVANKEHLVPLNEEQIGNVFSYPLDSPMLLGEDKVLDSNHSHFVLVDGKEDPVRREFENYRTLGGNTVPRILLVMEGRDMATVKLVFHAAWKNCTPCVLVKGSGGIADLLVFACNHASEIQENENCGNIHQGLLNEAEKIFPRDQEGHWMKLACEISKFRELFLIADVNAGVSVECAILHGLLRSITSMYEKMKFALLWNVPEFAQNELIKSIDAWNPDINDAKTELQGLLIMALALGRVGFVRLFNRIGISTKSVLTKNILGFLYAYRMNMDNSTIHHHQVIASRPESHPESANEFEKHQDIIKTLLRHKHKGKSGKVTTEFEVLRFDDIGHLLEKLAKSRIPKMHQKSRRHEEEQEATLQYPFHHLFVWSILNNMIDMSMMLWEFQDDAIAHALFAAQLCEELLTKARDKYTNTETLELMERCQATYQRLSIELMTECYKVDELNTKPLIAKSIDKTIVYSELRYSDSPERRLYEIFQGQSCLTLAKASNDKEFAQNFIAHRAVQDVLDDVWYGCIERKSITGYGILVYIFLPFLLFKENIRTKKNAGTMCFSGSDNVATREHSPLLKKIYYFYFHAPVVKFYLHAVGYLLFLLLFAYIAMLKKTTTTPGELEILLIVTIFGFAANEVAQIVLRDEPLLCWKIRGYFANIWNIFDVVCVTFFIIGLILRCRESTLQVGHLFYALDVSFWILRSLNILYIHQKIGPWVLMVGEMLIDLFHFLSILSVFLFSYGIAAKAILAPTKDDTQMFVSSIFKPYFHIMGEYFLDTPEDKNITWFGTPLLNSFAEPISLVLLGAYLLVANVLLLNLVIAIFNSTYEKIMGSAVTLWRYNKYEIVLEYAYRRSVLISPLSLLVHLTWFIKWLVCGVLCTLVSWCCCPRQRKLYTDIAKGFTHMDKEKLQQLRELEGSCLIKLLRRRREEESHH